MRKLIVGLLAVSLLVVAAPAIAQQADPLGLITSGAVIPYVGTLVAGSQSWIEVRSPIGSNTGAHGFFFDATCSQGPDSIGLGVTANGVLDRRVDNFANNAAIRAGGLLAIGQIGQDGFHLDPLSQPLHLNMYWVQAGPNIMRMLEPIGIDKAEGPGTLTWNPMRSAATLFSPLENPASFTTTIYFVCPTSNMLRIFTDDFPRLFPIPPATGTTSLDYRIYDTDESFIVDSHGTCACLSVQPLNTIASGVFDNPALAPTGTYVEIQGAQSLEARDRNGDLVPCTTEGEGGPTCWNRAFTGYRSLVVQNGAQKLDIFHRLSNAWACSIQGKEGILGECDNTGTGATNNDER